MAYAVYKRTLRPLRWHKIRSFERKLEALYEAIKQEKQGYTIKIIKEKY